MMFAKELRDGVRRGRIRSSVRIWQKPRVNIYLVRFHYLPAGAWDKPR